MTGALMRAFLGAATVMAAVACTPTVTEGGPQEVVSYGNSGSIHGGHTVTITPENRAVIRRRSGADPVVETTLTLEDGSFDRLRSAAMDIIEDAPPKLDTATPCLDAGSDFITLTDAAGRRSEWNAGCPDDGVHAGIQALSDMVRGATIQ